MDMDDQESAVKSSLITVGDCIRWGASAFKRHELIFAHGLQSAIDESAYLVLHALYLPIDTPECYFPCRINSFERDAVYHLLSERIRTRKPAAYLTHEAWFCQLPFYVDERVLIPRSPIASLIETHFSPWLDAAPPQRILDLCTGSGCIGIACAYAFVGAEVVLSDVCEAALEVAKENIQRHQLSPWVETVHSDLFENLPTDQGFDLIVSNPPYVDLKEMNALGQEFDHEPNDALASGALGLDHAVQILEQAALHLNDGGILVLEVGNSQYALMEYYPQIDFRWLELADEQGSGVLLIKKSELLSHFPKAAG